MRQFTKLALATVLAGLAAPSFAAQTTIEPTFSPASGNVESFPGEVVITWDDLNVVLNPDAPGFEDNMFTNINVSIGGEVVNPENPIYAISGEYIEEDWGSYWDTTSSENPGKALVIQSLQYIEYTPTDGLVMTITIPANSVYVGNYNSADQSDTYYTNWDTNAAITLTYTIGEPETPSAVKKLGDQVTLGPGNTTCDFKSGLNINTDMAIYTTSTTDISSEMSLVWEIGIGDPKVYKPSVIVTSDGTYAYNYENVTDEQIVFTYTGTEAVTFTFSSELATGEQQGGLTNGGDFELGKAFTASKEAQVWTLKNLTLDADCYLEISTTTNLSKNGQLVMTTFGKDSQDNILINWGGNPSSSTNAAFILGPEGHAAYTGHLNVTDATLTIVYTGNSSVTLKLGVGQYTTEGASTYMDEAKVLTPTVNGTDLNAAVEVTWQEEVTINTIPDGISYSINGVFQPVQLEATNLSLYTPDATDEPGIDLLTLTPGGKGTVLAINVGTAFGGDMEAGEYEFNLPDGLVVNANGDLSPAQKVKVTVENVQPVVGTVTPEDGTFNVGDDVTVKVTFEDAPVEAITDEDVVIYFETTGDDPVQVGLAWENGVTIEDNSVVITLGNELQAGTYYLSLIEGAVTVNGAPNALVEYNFTVEDNSPKVLDVQPTVTPASGAYANMSGGNVVMMWEGYTIALANESAEIVVKLNNEPVDPNDGQGWNWYYVDAQGEIIWEETEGTVKAGISVSLPFYYSDENNWDYEIVVPEGMFSLTSENESGVNAMVALSYTGVAFSDDNFVVDPAKGTSMKSLTTFNVEWDNCEEVALNEALANTVTYGPWFGPIEGYAVVAANEDGSYSVTLEEEYTTQGYVEVTFPEGLFTLTVDGVSFQSPQTSVTYLIESYRVVPADQSMLEEAFDSFTIYADNVSVVGDVKNITLTYESYEGEYEIVTYTTGASYETVSDENGNGVKVTMDEAFNVNTTFNVNIPAGVFSIDGADNKAITLTYYMSIKEPVPAPTVTPENDSEIEALSSVELSWNDSPLYTYWDWEENGDPFTLTITPASGAEAGEPIDISELVEIVNEEEETDYGTQVLSSKLVITFNQAYTGYGIYVINVPANCVEIENYEYQLNDAVTLTYIISDPTNVSSLVGAENGVWTVYTLNGVKVLESSNAADLNNLAAGLYIINGKKVLLRK